ncbi:ARM repeat-containing protein [Metschnikowia bicuspidata var. bicuspidata NRRL YB-4993]|uniref:ARM repeat-containing protein n=1 Tax=Metschnikowia bicuspidata var. bicuspidata NRRL YB-4993 TaxID=869754 RepID=A0A1A0H916_9ASCO|nr:ARM repeat-containing protein [Metschnikowia bicuspidata var. bicuspidata NRRL YB-4993]OBA20495.1 ARM repeat-containing protein [Metschnikowia bicuspidata var. bicuspidata NRRL YB-4993]
MDQVQQALVAMYSPAVLQDQKKEATTFLENFQKSPEAWEISHLLLADGQTPLEYRMFASQTLRSKSTYDLLQLPNEALPLLKDSMLELLSVYAAKEKLIRTQLSLALCQLALQYLGWLNAINDITARLLTQEHVPALLEFLKSLPEELTDANKTPLTDEEFNSRTSELITSNVQHVLLLLKSLIDSGSAHRALILDCLNSWIKECPIEDVLGIDSLASLIFESLAREDTFDHAVECVCSILRETRDIDNYQLIDALYQQLLQAYEHYSKRPDQLEDPEIFNGLTRIYVEAGESWHVLIAKSPAHFKPLVEILLRCCKYDEDLDVVKYTFYFWYQLKQMLTLPRFEESRAEFLPLYLELILVIINHLRYPLGDNADDLFDGNKEQEDKFKDFRYEMGDVLKDCCAVVGAQKALDVPFQQIKALVNQNPQWQYLEAPLFSMRVMAKEVSLKEKKILPVIMQMLVQLPEHPKIRYATTLVLGRYSEWTSKNPEFLEPQLNYIIKGFENAQHTGSEIINATSQALMFFCQDCAILLVNYLEQLYMLYRQVHAALDVKATFDLVDGLSHVIGKIPLADQYRAAETFLEPTLHRMGELCSQGQPGDDPTIKALVDEAEVLSIFLKILRCHDYSIPEFPIANVFMDKIWPLIPLGFAKYGDSLKICESFCKVTRNAVHGSTRYLTPKLGEISQLLHQGFQKTFFGCFLWVTGVIIQCSEDFSDEVCAQVIYPLAISQSGSVLDLFRSDSNIDLRSIPDVIEDYFNMASHLLMFYPTEIAGNEHFMSSIFETGVVALKVSEEYNPLMACVHFFIDYISWGSDYPPVSFFEGDHQAIKENVKKFLAMDRHTHNLLEVVIYGLIHKFYNDVDGNDLLIKILTVSPDSAQAVLWLKQSVASLPNVSEQEITKLIGTISVALPNKDNRRIRMAIKDFVSWYTRKNVNSRAAFN